MSANKEIEIRESAHTGLPTRRTLLFIMALSIALDYMLMSMEMPLVFVTFGFSIVVEEIIELILSTQLAKYGLENKLSRTDKIIGFIPIPGVTAIAVRCLKELIKGNYDHGPRAHDEIEVIEYHED